MAKRSLSNSVSCGSSGAFALALGLALSSCGADKDGTQGPVGPSTSGDLSSTTTSQSSTGATGTTATNTAQSSTSGTSSAGGTSSSTGSPDTDTESTSTGATGDSGGTGATGSDSGSGNTGGDGSDSESDTSTSGGTESNQSSGPAGSSDAETSAPPSTECTRELLDSLIDDYFAALSAGDPSSLPLADDVKFTENAEIAEIGSTAFWMNAGDAKYSQRALDTVECGAAVQAVIPEGATDLPVGLRIKVDAGKLTEIETIVVRAGDYNASFGVPSNTQAIITISEDIGWHDEVTEADRATREELSGWIDKYFRAFPSGVCNVTQSCRRLENGGGGSGGDIGFSCNAGATCSGSNTSATGFPPRLIVVDEVRGITAGFTIFDFQDAGHLDMHMAKMSGGEVHAVHALLRDTDGESGWD